MSTSQVPREKAARAADPAAVCLALSGTLLSDGQVYLPGRWPTYAPKAIHLNRTPYQGPTVPLKFIGINPIARSNPKQFVQVSVVLGDDLEPIGQ